VQVRKKENQKVYAMKILNKAKLAQTDQLEHIKTERAVMQFIEHPFLVKLYYAFQTVDKLYMVRFDFEKSCFFNTFQTDKFIFINTVAALFKKKCYSCCFFFWFNYRWL